MFALRGVRERLDSLRRFRPADGEDGQGLAEYALIITFVALVVVGSLTALGTSIASPINTVSTKF